MLNNIEISENEKIIENEIDKLLTNFPLCYRDLLVIDNIKQYRDALRKVAIISLNQKMLNCLNLKVGSVFQFKSTIVDNKWDKGLKVVTNIDGGIISVASLSQETYKLTLTKNEYTTSILNVNDAKFVYLTTLIYSF